MPAEVAHKEGLVQHRIVLLAADLHHCHVGFLLAFDTLIERLEQFFSTLALFQIFQSCGRT